MSATLELTQELIARASVTPADEGCQELMAERLAALGFRGRAAALRQRREPLGAARQRRPGAVLCRAHRRGAHRAAGGMALGSVQAGGPRRLALRSRRRRHEERPGRHGDGDRGSSSREQPDHRGALAFLITSDEEGPSVDGTKRVVETLRERGERIDWCMVGEPSSEKQHRRHHQDRPPRLTVGTAHGARRAGPHRLSAAGRESRAQLRAGTGRAGQPRLGPGQRALPAHELPGLESERRHRRAERHSRASSRRASTCAIRRCRRSRAQAHGRGDPARATG